MREGWQRKQLGEIAQVKGGKRVPKGYKLQAEETNHPYIAVSDFSDDGTIDTSGLRYISDEIFAEIERYTISSKDLFISIAGTIGKTGSVPPELDGANFTENACKLVFDPGIYKDFVYYFTKTDDFTRQAEKNTRVAAQPKLALERLKTITLMIPPLPEQKRVVAILDDAFEGIGVAIANADKNRASARELFEIYLNSVFARKGKGWVEKKLSDVCSIASKLVDPRKSAFVDLPHLGAGNMISKTGELVDIKTAREEGLKSGKFLFDDKIVLYSKIRPYLMKACRPDFSGLCSADVYPLLPDKMHLDRNFLFHMLMSRQFTNYAIAGSDRAGMPKVNRDHLFRYSVWLPAVDEQMRLASKLDAISAESGRLEAIYQQKLDSLAELKQAILQKAFAGELTAQPEKALQEAAAA